MNATKPPPGARLQVLGISYGLVRPRSLQVIGQVIVSEADDLPI